jgi:hypothetical protein
MHNNSWTHTIWGICITEDSHVVSWIMTPFGLVFGNYCFRRTSWLHLQGVKVEVIHSSEKWYPSVRLYTVIRQKTTALSNNRTYQ